MGNDCAFGMLLICVVGITTVTDEHVVVTKIRNCMYVFIL